MDMRISAVAALGVLAVLASGCGSPGGSTASAARTASTPTSAVATASAVSTTYTPTSSSNTLNVLAPASPPSADAVARMNGITCSGPIGPSDPVANVQLHTGSWVIRDYADPAHPRTVCQFPPSIPSADLIDAHHVLVAAPTYMYAVIQIPEMSMSWFQLPNVGDQGPSLVAVSLSLDQVAYLTVDIADNTDKVHVATTAGDTVVASLPNPHGGRCGSPEDSRPGDYTHSGSAVYVLDEPFPTLNSLLVLKDGQGKLQFIPQVSIASGGTMSGGWKLGAQPAMPVWSPTSETLYYRKDGSIWKWTSANGPQLFLQGVSWYYPTISADGAHLAYAVVRADGLHNVYLVDLAHEGSPQLIGKGARNLPVFLNSTQLWYRSEAQGICGPGGNLPLVYDLGDGSEAPSIIDFVGSVWPSTSSNF